MFLYAFVCLFTRVEIKIYSTTIYSHKNYELFLHKVLNSLIGCKVYKTSFKQQWMALVEHIESVLTIYDSNMGIYGYCHWYNGTTGKKQGIIRAGVTEREVPTLLVNYSFNRKPIHYLELAIGSFGEYTIIGGLYHNKISLNILFPKAGFVKYHGVQIDWLLDIINKNSLPTLHLVDITTGLQSEGRIEILNVTSTFKYQAGYVVRLVLYMKL